MAQLQGISGLKWGDGNGGQVALSIHTNVLRILRNDKLSYLTATMRNPGSVKNGTASYYVPEIIGTKDYDAGDATFADPETGLVSFNLDTRRQAKYEIETFDISRLQEANYLMGEIAVGLAYSIQADLNSAFLSYLVKQFDGSSGALRTQVLELATIGKPDPAMTPEKARVDYNTWQYKIIDISRQYNKKLLGVPKADMFNIVSPRLDVGIRNAFWNQPSEIGKFVIKDTLEGNKLGNIKYIVDDMLDLSIGAGTSFTDKDFNTTDFIGFILHNEAVAMPINLISTTQTINPNNANLRFITKYQYGIGTLRPTLIWAIKNKAAK